MTVSYTHLDVYKRQFQKRLRNLLEILPPKAGSAEVCVEVGHRQHYPVGILRLIGKVVGYQRRDYIQRNALGRERAKLLHQRGRQLWFLFPEWPKFQRLEMCIRDSMDNSWAISL